MWILFNYVLERRRDLSLFKLTWTPSIRPNPPILLTKCVSIRACTFNSFSLFKEILNVVLMEPGIPFFPGQTVWYWKIKHKIMVEDFIITLKFNMITCYLMSMFKMTAIHIQLVLGPLWINVGLKPNHLENKRYNFSLFLLSMLFSLSANLYQKE